MIRSATNLQRSTFALACLLALVAGCRPTDSTTAVESKGSSQAAERQPQGPTFSREIAPLVYAHCAVCHHPDGAGPFSLLTYEDVKKRGRQIVQVTGSRFMPPWLASGGDCEFEGDLHLSGEQIALLRQWVEAGTPAGDRAQAPALPKWPDGWRLGKPDLIVTMPKPYRLAADGTDVWRRFVLPLPVESSRFVRAVEIRPGNKRIVHHAVAMVDSSGYSRRMAGKDGQVGYDAMIVSQGVRNPDGHFLSWLPGMVPYEDDPDMSWRLDPGTDLVVEAHMLPSGKAEEVSISVGLYFSDRPPTKSPVGILLHSEKIDIPAGSTNTEVTDDYTLPVDVDLLALYPHAHLLGKEIDVAATLPGGKRLALLKIPQWDFNWQTAYRPTKPAPLPAGTKISLRIGFDNSADNVRNPHSPPQRVRFGYGSHDEMAQLKLQVLPRSREDASRLVSDFTAKDAEKTIEGLRFQVKLTPDNARALLDLGVNLGATGHRDEAIQYLDRASQLEPKNPQPYYYLGLAALERSERAEARRLFEKAIEVDPEFYLALSELGSWWMAGGELKRAQELLEKSLKIYPDDAATHNNLAIVRFQQGLLFDARLEVEEALRINPDYGPALDNLRKLDALRRR